MQVLKFCSSDCKKNPKKKFGEYFEKKKSCEFLKKEKKKRSSYSQKVLKKVVYAFNEKLII